MNGDYKEKNLFQSMKMNSLTNIPNYLNTLQYISMDMKNKNTNNNNNINTNFEEIKNENQNNGQLNILNISENELFNYELDQSTESIILNQSLSKQIPFDYPSKNNNKNNINFFENRNELGAFKGNEIINLKNNNYNNEYINSLEEKLKQENLKNNELKNHIEILKQTINGTLLKKKNLEIEGWDNASNELKKSKIDILTEYTSLKLENEKIKKQLVMQQILYTDMKNEIQNLKQDNNSLKISLENATKENKNLSKIKDEITNNYNILLNESDEIKNTLLKYEEEFTNCQKNNSDYIRLKSENFELNNNYEKQKSILNNLQNDFDKINKANIELNKYNEKLVKENQQIKRELFHKKNELENVNNKMNLNLNDFKENNDLLLKEKDDLINNMQNIKEKNNKLSEIKDNQKIEIESLNQIIKTKNDEILKYLKEIENLKNKNSNNLLNIIQNNNDKMSSDINLDLIINNVQNELKEKNKLIEDLKAQNIKLIKENENKENTINEYIIKEDMNKKEIDNMNNEDKKYKEQIDRLNTFIKQKELEIYSLKNNEKSYNKIIDLSCQSIKQFINKLKTYEEFKEDDEMYINLDDNNKINSEDNLFIRPLKEFVSKMSEENINNNNNYYNENNIPLIEKIKKINIFANIIPFEINVLYNKVKTLLQENQVLLNIKNKSNNLNNIEEMKMNKTPDNKSIIDMNNGNKFDFFDSFKKFNSDNNNMLFPTSNSQQKNFQNIQNIKTINATRNNKLEYSNNEYRTSSNSQKKILNYEQETNNEQKLDKINLKVKEINNYIFNNQAPKTIFDEEEINYNDNNKTMNKAGKKSKITLFKEEISNKSFINNNQVKETKNIFLSIQTSPENKQRNFGNNKLNRKNSKNSINNNLTNLSQLVFQNNGSKINNNINYMNKNISQPITNRPINNILSNPKKDSFPNNRNHKKILSQLNTSSTYKNVINSHTMDSTRLNNNLTPLLNDNSFLNKNRKNEDKNNKKNNELYHKSINGLADEVMKPSFLKSDVSLTMLGNNFNNNNGSNSINTSTDSFLFLAKKNIKKKNKQNESYSFVEIQNNVKRSSSPFNKDKKSTKSNLNRNRSFLY